MMQSRDSAQIGIGTLIVFIALVLVAAIAAGVLISSADLLQERGENTSEETVSEVSDQLIVTSVYGDVVDPNDTEDNFDSVNEPRIGTIKINVRTASGASDVNIHSATIDILGDTDHTLSYTLATTPQLNPKNNTNVEAGSEFTTRSLTTPGAVAGSGEILESGDRSQIQFNLIGEESGASGPDDRIFDESLVGGERLRMTIVTNAGAETIVIARAPETLTQNSGKTLAL